MKVITAPEYPTLDYMDVTCFLAGGITNCIDWQNEVINQLKDFNEHLVLCNPRRANFPINDPNASLEQITWEYKFLEKCEIFSMYFDGTDKSDQPICFYELGRNIERMKQKFSMNWDKHIIISVDMNFKRASDVIIQTKLATNDQVKVNINYNSEELIKQHVELIKQSYQFCSKGKYFG